MADANGVTKGRIAIRGPDGQWVNKNAETTFFPDHWSRRKTEQEIASAFQNSTRRTTPTGGSYWTGTTSSGVPVTGYYNPAGTGASTAFPIYRTR